MIIVQKMSNTVFPCSKSTEDISINAAFVSLTSSDHCTKKMSNTVFPCRILTDDISINAAFVYIISSDDIIRTVHSIQDWHRNKCCICDRNISDHCSKMSNTVFPCRISTEGISTNAAFVCITSSDDIIRTAHSIQTLHHNKSSICAPNIQWSLYKKVQYCISLQGIHWRH